MKILIIEDDRDFSYALQSQLTDRGFEVDVCANGSDGLFYIRQQMYHLILLDRLLPILDGMNLLQIIRSQNITTPVIFITGLGELAQKVEGLNWGADDYLVKPFAFEELLARIYCILRRPPVLKTSHPISAGDLTYDSLTRKLTCRQKSCTLTVKEGALLELFLDHPGQILTRDYIFSEIWGNDTDVESGNLDNFIYFLRNRLRSVESRSSLNTIRGTGYQFHCF